jgi:hypothetical protein
MFGGDSLMITETEMTLSDMKRIAGDGHLCGECGGRLVVAWINGGHVLRCSNLKHSTITSHDYKNEERIRRYRMDSTALTKLTKAQMMERVKMGPKFVQDLTPAEQEKLGLLASFYGFDAAMGEMTIYQGRPYISIDGRYRKAQETGKLAGVNTIPATAAERKAWEIPDGDYFFKAIVKVRDGDNISEFTGWGRVFAAETKPGSKNDPNSKYKPIQSNPQRMAEKRAEAQALRKAFHIDLPSIEDVGTPDDPNIIESTITIDEAHFVAESRKDRVLGDTDIPATIGELCAWAIKNGKQFNGSWVAAQVGEKTAADIKDIKNAYFTIKEITGWEAYKKGGD